jgi:hypothetical protein
MRQLSALLLMLALLVPLLASPATAYSLNVPSRQLSELVPSEGGALMRILLRDEQPGVDGVPTAKVVLRNGHSLWYVVTYRRAAVPGATLRSWVLLPPCRAEHATEYSCEGADAVLGRLPLRPGNELVLFGDGVASDELGRQVLGLIWAGELISRVGFQEPLPTNVGAALDGVECCGRGSRGCRSRLWCIKRCEHAARGRDHRSGWILRTRWLDLALRLAMP